MCSNTREKKISFPIISKLFFFVFIYTFSFWHISRLHYLIFMYRSYHCNTKQKVDVVYVEIVDIVELRGEEGWKAMTYNNLNERIQDTVERNNRTMLACKKENLSLNILLLFVNNNNKEGRGWGGNNYNWSIFEFFIEII
jgi:hypothetical protein